MTTSARAVPLVHPALVHVTTDLAGMLPEEVARRLMLLPVLVSGNSILWLAMGDPHDQAALAECARLTGRRARAMAAPVDEIRASFHRWYGGPPPRPAPAPPKRSISVMELDQEDAVVRASVAPPGAIIDASRPATITPPRPATVMVVQALPGVVAACRNVFVDTDVVVRDVDLIEAATAAHQLMPFAIVLPEDVHDFDPFAFETLALSVRALLVVAREGGTGHLRPLLATAHRRLFGLKGPCPPGIFSPALAPTARYLRAQSTALRNTSAYSPASRCRSYRSIP